MSQLCPSFDLKSQAAHAKLCGALWRVARAVLDPLEVTALAAKTACTCPWSVTAVSKLWPKVASCPWKAVRALWRVARAVLDPLEVTALAAKTACTCPWSVTAVSKLWPKVASCPWKAVRGPLKGWDGSPGSLRSYNFGGRTGWWSVWTWLQRWKDRSMLDTFGDPRRRPALDIATAGSADSRWCPTINQATKSKFLGSNHQLKNVKARGVFGVWGQMVWVEV